MDTEARYEVTTPYDVGSKTPKTSENSNSMWIFSREKRRKAKLHSVLFRHGSLMISTLLEKKRKKMDLFGWKEN
jgi:hypothetical protein